MPADPLPFDPTPESDESYGRTRSFLKERFAEWSATNWPELDEDGGEALIHYKWAYLDGDLTRWDRADLEQIYLELFPAKVLMDDDEVDSVLEEGRAFLTFLSESGWLADDSDELGAMVHHLGQMGPAFASAMADESLHSPGKRIWTEARAEGVEMDDRRAVNAFMDRYNARIRGGRPSPLGRSPFDLPAGGLPRQSSPSSLRLVSGRATPPGTPPQPKRSADKRRRRGR